MYNQPGSYNAHPAQEMYHQPMGELADPQLTPMGETDLQRAPFNSYTVPMHLQTAPSNTFTMGPMTGHPQYDSQGTGHLQYDSQGTGHLQYDSQRTGHLQYDTAQIMYPQPGSYNTNPAQGTYHQSMET